MNEKQQIHKLIESVIDESLEEPTITAESIAHRAYEKLDPEHVSPEMVREQALDHLKQVAARALRNRFENPAAATPEHIEAVKDYARRRWEISH
jgi:hypothetical protein